jgi:hypothetical protein
MYLHLAAGKEGRPAKTECSSCGPGVAGTSKLIITYSR